MSLIESFLGFSWFFVDDIAMIIPILNLVDDVDHVFQLLIRRCPTKRAHHLIHSQTSKFAAWPPQLINWQTKRQVKFFIIIIKIFGVF